MLITLALLHAEKGGGSMPPTHASWRHTNKVDTAMAVPTPRIQENIWVLGQPRTARRKRVNSFKVMKSTSVTRNQSEFYNKNIGNRLAGNVSIPHHFSGNILKLNY